MRQSPLESLAPELICRIASHLVLDESSYIGPPSAVLAFVSTSRSIHRAVSLSTNAQFLSYIFAFKFDQAAPLRRLGPHRVNALSYASELRKRFKAMSRIRHGSICQEHLDDDLWTSLLMLLENDGRNERQLTEWARLPAFIIKYLRSLNATMASDESGLNWTLRSPTFSLALWTLYLLTRLDAFTNECPEDAVFLKNFLRPIVVSAYRFPGVHASEKLFHVGQTPQSKHLESGHCSVCYSAHTRLTATTATITHFAAPLAVAEPPLNPAAFLSLIIRLDTAVANETRRVSSSQLQNHIQTEPNASEGEDSMPGEHTPRLHASQLVARPPSILHATRQWVGATRNSDSRQSDLLWRRLTVCVDSCLPLLKTPEISSRSSVDGSFFATFTPGELCGRWSGKLMIPDYQAYHDLITNSPSASPSGVALYQQPMKLFLREHHSTYLGPTAQSADNTEESDSYLNAWFPEKSTFEEDKFRGILTITHPRSPKRAHYVTYHQREQVVLNNVPGVEHRAHQLVENYDAGVASAPLPETVDIVLTGETEEKSGEQYGHYTFIGRVRAWDGLVVLVRKPMYSDHAALGNWVFMGYLVSTGLIVGRWRDTCGNSAVPPYEGPFVLSLENTC